MGIETTESFHLYRHSRCSGNPRKRPGTELGACRVGCLKRERSEWSTPVWIREQGMQEALFCACLRDRRARRCHAMEKVVPGAHYSNAAVERAHTALGSPGYGGPTSCPMSENQIIWSKGGFMNRREFLRSAGATSAASLAFPKMACLLAEGAASGSWRTFEVKTRVEVLKPSGTTRVWLPAALSSKTPFQNTLSNKFQRRGRHGARLSKCRRDGLGIIAAEFPAGVKPVLTLTSRVATRNYVVDLSSPGTAPKADRAELEHFLRPTRLLPTDGIVKATATEITSRARTDLEKARAIYEWIVDNTFRNPKTRGCGIGDIRFMLESKDLGGKCADLNALYVGLARAAGLPARDVYGIRVAKSELGYKSLGTSSENITKAQHCRAEVYLGGLRLDSCRSGRRAESRA